MMNPRNTDELPNGCCGCCWGRCPRFSYISTAFISVWGLIGLILLLVSSWNWLLLPLILLPAGVIFYFIYWKNLRIGLGDAKDDDLVLRMCAGGCVPGAGCALLAELILGLIFFAICYGSQVSAYAQEKAKHEGDPTWEDPGLNLAYDGRYFLNLFLNAFITAALVEESIKAGMVRCQVCCGPDRACCLQRPLPDPKKQAYMTIALVVAASVGFSTMENLIYVLTTDTDGLGWSVLLALTRGIVSTPVHAICGGFTGFRLTIRDVQLRQRDTAVLTTQTTAGAPALVMLPSGVVVQVITPSPDQQAAAQQQYQAQRQLQSSQASNELSVSSMINSLYPPPEGQASSAVGIVASSASASSASAAARQVQVWGWLRVLWPALLIHGTFDFILLCFSSMESNAANVSLSIFVSLVVVISSGWALWSQIDAALSIVTRGRIPERVTCAPVWWPEWLKSLVRSSGFSSQGDGSVAAAEDEGYAPINASLLDNNVPSHEINGSERLLHAGVEVADIRVVSDGAALVDQAPALPQGVHPALAALSNSTDAPPATATGNGEQK
jgi:RsiW-degrading membrane proteinase PrsW (M82 family)